MNETIKKQVNTKLAKKLNPEKISFRPLCAICRSQQVVHEVHYFDEDGYFHVDTPENTIDKIEGVIRRENGTYYVAETLRKFIGPGEDAILFRKALSKLKENDTWEEFLLICENIRYEARTPEEPSFLSRFIARIERPEFIRVPENQNSETFDFVKVRLCLASITENIPQSVKDNFAEIHDMALEKIRCSKSFQRYGVPVNILRLTNAIITKQQVLEQTYELKEV